MGAIEGMLFPALIYIFLNAGNSIEMKDWSVPAAADINKLIEIVVCHHNR